MKRIGFIGIGVMGKSMARNLMRGGCEVAVYTRTKEKARELLAAGATWCESAGACAAGRDAVITMVGYPADVEQVYFGPEGIIAQATPGAYLIDMTTTSPALSQRIYREGRARGLHALDAPVSGGDVGAQNAALSIMVGGDEPDFRACLPLLGLMGKQIVYQGGPGSGQHTKMANQIAIAGAISGVCEALAYGRAMGLDPDTMLSSISGGAAGSWQMSNLAPRIVKGDLAPGFYLKHFVKDMSIAQQAAQEQGVELAVLERVLETYRRLEAEGCGDLGTQALIKHYEP